MFAEMSASLSAFLAPVSSCVREMESERKGSGHISFFFFFKKSLLTVTCETAAYDSEANFCCDNATVFTLVDFTYSWSQPSNACCEEVNCFLFVSKRLARDHTTIFSYPQSDIWGLIHYSDDEVIDTLVLYSDIAPVFYLNALVPALNIHIFACVSLSIVEFIHLDLQHMCLSATQRY